MQNNNQYSIRVDNGTVYLAGRIVFENVVTIKNFGESIMQQLPIVKLDLSSVEYSDSSILALISAWFKFAKKSNKCFVLSNMQSVVKELARVHGLLDLLEQKLSN